MLQALKQETSVSGAVPTTTVGQTGEMKRLVDWIQTAHNSVQTQYANWFFLWATATQSVSTRTVTKPSDHNYWDAKRFTLNGVYIPAQSYNDYTPDTVIQTAPPTKVIIMPNGNLMFDTTPDTTYTLGYDYFKLPVILAADSDTSPIPDHLQRVILGDAMVRYGNYESAQDMVNQGQAMFQEYMRKLMNMQSGLEQVDYQLSQADIVVRTY